MELKVIRRWFTPESTMGDLYLDPDCKTWECFTLELTFIEGRNDHNKTCIPAGRYEVIIDWSEHFEELKPHILNVSNRDGIRIHSGNHASDTDGCILVGMTRADNFVGLSKRAYEDFFEKLRVSNEEHHVNGPHITEDYKKYIRDSLDFIMDRVSSIESFLRNGKKSQ